MKKITIFALVLLLLSNILPVGKVLAGELTEVSLRLDRTKSNTSISGTVCAKPASAGSGLEAKIAISFPSDFTINSSLANWTTDTNSLPSGSTAWPGISAIATEISGQTVTFTSSDLTSTAAQYCFNLQSTSSTTGSAGSKVGTLRTRTAGNITIDQKDFAVAIVNNDQLSITAVVPAAPDDFVAALTLVSPTTTPVAQNTTLTYELTYGSNLVYASSITVVADWTLGTITGSGSPTVETLEYVIGSASNAYGNAPPIVDLVNRKISWTIPNFPANTTGQSVTFKLRTNANYTGTSTVSFTAQGRVLGPGTQSVDSTITSQYLYVTPPPGPTPTPGPATPVPTATPTPNRTPFRFDDVTLTRVTSTDAEITAQLSKDGSITTNYGTDPNQMNQTITSLSQRRSHRIKFPNLTPDTIYYFQLIARDQAGRRITSDIFTFYSAKISKSPKVATNSLIATSEKIIVYNPFLGLPKKNTIVIPQKTTFELQFSLAEKTDVKSIQALIRNKNVLGINSIVGVVEASTGSVQMMEIEPGVYAGRLMTSLPGEYEIYTRVQDFNGNISEEKVADLKVLKRFMIQEVGSGRPIENAKVALSLYSPRTKLFEYISTSTLPIQNPSFSDATGEVLLVLPQGKYKAEISSLGRKDQRVEFTIGPYLNEDFPTVVMNQSSFSLLLPIQKFVAACVDVFTLTKEFITRLVTSGRFLELNAMITALCFVILTFLAFSAKFHISLLHLPYYLKHRKKLLETPQSERITGTVMDLKKDIPLQSADIFLLDQETNKILMHTKSDSLGKFTFQKHPESNYKIQIDTINYKPVTFQKINQENLVLGVHGDNTLLSVKENLKWVGENVFSMLFEVLLFLSLALEVLLIYTFGLAVVAPFLTISLLNLSLWLMHIRHAYNQTHS